MKIIKFILILALLIPTLSSGQSILNKYESAVRLLEKGESNSAIEKFQEILEIRPYYYDAFVGIGRAYLHEGKEKEALENFDKALEIKDGWYAAHYYRAILHQEYGRSRLAMKDIDNCLKGRPDYLPALLLRGRILREQGDYQASINILSDAISKAEHRVTSDFYVERAKAYTHLNKFPEAIDDIDDAFSIGNPDDSLYHFRSVLHALNSDTASAVKDLNRYLSTDENDLSARKSRAHYLYSIKEYNASIADLNILIEENRITDDPALFELRARAHAAAKDYDAAVKDVSRAIMGDRERTDLYLFRAEIYTKAGKDNAALADYRRLIRFGADDPRPWIGRAKYYIGYKRWDVAIEDLTEAIKIKPTGEGHYQRAICFYELRKDKEACDDLEAAAQLGHKEAVEKQGEFCR